MHLRLNDNHYITSVIAEITHSSNMNVSVTYNFGFDTFKHVMESPYNWSKCVSVKVFLSILAEINNK